MLIAIVVSFTLSGRGGMESSTGIAVRELEKYGDTVHIIMPDGQTDPAWSAGLNCHYIPVPYKQFRRWVFTYKLTLLLNDLQPDLVLGLDPRAVAYARFYRYLRYNKVRIGSWLRFALQAHGKKDPPRLLKYADFHLAISSRMADVLSRRFKKPVYLVFNPIKLAEKTISRPAIPTFIYVGRLCNHIKQVKNFLHALAELCGTWKATIIGDGSDANQLKQLARNLGIHDRIEWMGWVRDPWNHVAEASALVLVSQSEGFPNVLAEAINRGLPCISSDCPNGPEDIIINGKNGWLYPVNDLESLRKLMQRVVEDPLLSFPDPQTVKESGKRFAAEKIVFGIRSALVKELSKTRVATTQQDNDNEER